MNSLTKEIVEQIENEYAVSFYRGDLTEQVPFAQADTITFHFLKEDFSHIGKSFKLPKKKKVNLGFFLEKIESDNVYINFAKKFGTLINHNGLTCYPTTYGIGIFVGIGLRDSVSKIKTEISNKLNEKGIKFTTELSDAAYVFRYKISKSKENIAKL